MPESSVRREPPQAMHVLQMRQNAATISTEAAPPTDRESEKEREREGGREKEREGDSEKERRRERDMYQSQHDN